MNEVSVTLLQDSGSGQDRAILSYNYVRQVTARKLQCAPLNDGSQLVWVHQQVRQRLHSDHVGNNVEASFRDR